MAGKNISKGDYLCDIMKPYAMEAKERSSKPKEISSNSKESSLETGESSLTNIQESKSKDKKTEQKIVEKVVLTNDRHLNDLSSAWLSLLQNGINCDLTIQSKEGTELKCHSLVLLARCKDMLNEILLETDVRGKERQILSWGHIPEEAIKIVLRYLYSGQFMDIVKTSVLRGVENLCEEYRLIGLSELVKENVKTDLLVPEEDEEEQERVLAKLLLLLLLLLRRRRRRRRRGAK